MQHWQQYGRMLNQIGLRWVITRTNYGYTALLYSPGLDDPDVFGEGWAWTRYRALRKAFRHYRQQL